MRASSCAFRWARTASGSFGPRMAGVPGCSLSAFWMFGRGFSLDCAVIMLSADAWTPLSAGVASVFVVGAPRATVGASAMAETANGAKRRSRTTAERKRRIEA